MVQLQCLNRILASKDLSIIFNNALDESYFTPYENEYRYIIEHFKQYKVVPDKETFIEKFPEFDLVDVAESDKYLVDALSEEKMYRDAVPVVQKTAEILKTNANDAVHYLMANAEILNQKIGVSCVDIMNDAQHRLEMWKNKKNGSDSDYYITTGFQELDDVIHGWSRGEELVVFFARTNQGKSWILAKTLTHAWQLGFNVGFISPEMSADKIGYRVDTLIKHFDNQALNWGKDIDGYDDYINGVKGKDNKFIVSTTQDFGNSMTISKLRSFIEVNKLDIIGIDGISYMVDERRERLDNTQAQLTHISEDLYSLSMELRIPILAVVQANRDGVKINGGDLQLENIRDADGISYNASKVISIRQRVDEETVEFTIKKSRDSKVGDKIIYKWIPNIGDFTYIPSDDDCATTERREERTAEITKDLQPTRKKGVVF